MKNQKEVRRRKTMHEGGRTPEEAPWNKNTVGRMLEEGPRKMSPD